MKPFIALFCLLLIGLTIYIVPSSHQEVIKLLSYSECDTPLPYSLGSIDTRFGLSTSEVQQDITTATNIWTNVEGKPLFTYQPNAQLTVNFVYDQRQALDTNINQLDTSLKQKNQSLQEQIDTYKAQEQAFKQELNAFTNRVDKYNQEDGAPPNIYNQLIQQQNQLRAQANTMNVKARQLNLATHDYNAGVSLLNQNVNEFNQTLAKKPEEGLYNSGNNTITIYFAANQQELLHTLAHEFGHSLGMVHVTDPTAIMYPYTTTNLAVTPDDKQQLDYVCREQSAIVHWLKVFDLWVATNMQSIK